MSETTTTLVQAWGRWVNGVQLNDYFLWGIKILWWGRIGKCLEFFGALTIVVEIIGPIRLRQLGRELRLTQLFESKRTQSERIFRRESEAELGCQKNLWWVLVILFWFSFLFTSAFVLSRVFPKSNELPCFGPILWWTTAIASWLVVDYLVLRPISWLMENKFSNQLIKLAAVWMLLVGFHFDLLAS